MCEAGSLWGQLQLSAATSRQRQCHSPLPAALRPPHKMELRYLLLLCLCLPPLALARLHA